MRRRVKYLFCAMAVCVSLIGCNASQEEPVDVVASKTESGESKTENNESKTDNQEITDLIDTVTDSGEEVIQSKNKVTPLPGYIDMDNLDNCTVAVSFGKGDAYVDDTGAMQLDVTVYTFDLYDMVDMATLQVGDTIVIRDQEVTVTALERVDRGILINGGLDANGYEFRTDESTVWYEIGYSDMKSYYEVGTKTIRVWADMRFHDNSDLDKGEKIFYPGDFLINCEELIYHFVPHNTSIVIENGKVVAIYRSYMP